MPKSHVFAHKTLAVLSLLIVSGCANLNQVLPGAPLAEVQAQFGASNFSCDHPDGTRRVIWTRQPMGQFAWETNVGADGRIDQVTPVLTDKNFQQLATGTWAAERVRCEFGPPLQISAR